MYITAKRMHIFNISLKNVSFFSVNIYFNFYHSHKIYNSFSVKSLWVISWVFSFISFFLLNYYFRREPISLNIVIFKIISIFLFSREHFVSFGRHLSFFFFSPFAFHVFRFYRLFVFKFRLTVILLWNITSTDKPGY